MAETLLRTRGQHRDSAGEHQKRFETWSLFDCQCFLEAITSLPRSEPTKKTNRQAYGKGLWRDPTVCGLNCKIFSCQEYLFTLPLPQKRLSLKRKFCLFVRYHILFLRILQISVFCFLFEKADCSIFAQLFGWSVGVIISFPSPNIFLLFLSLSLANNGTFASGRHNLQSFIAANLTQNYFLIARMLCFFVIFATTVPFLTFRDKMWIFVVQEVKPSGLNS